MRPATEYADDILSQLEHRRAPHPSKALESAIRACQKWRKTLAASEASDPPQNPPPGPGGDPTP